MNMPAQSTEYVYVPVTCEDPSGTTYSPTGDPVQIAFPAHGSIPTDEDWQTATWATLSNGNVEAAVLVGPGAGGLNLGAGNYDVWVQITASPEIPWLLAGQLNID